VLIEDWLAKQDEKVEKEVEKACKRFGESFDETKYRETSPRVAETLAKRDEVHKRFVAAQNANDLNERVRSSSITRSCARFRVRATGRRCASST